MKKNIHGTFNSLESFGKALGIKSKKQTEKTQKCRNCGGSLRQIEGTNTWVCDFNKLEEKKLGNKEVQVFSPCGNTVLINS